MYQVSLPLSYKAASNRGPVQGFGQTRMMSSKDIVFAPGGGLEPSMNAEIVVGWPSLLDDDPLQLVLQVTITGTQDGVAEAGAYPGLPFRYRFVAVKVLVLRAC